MANTIYLGTIDAGGRGDELLLKAINAKEGEDYKLEEFGFGEPTPVDVPNPTRNTKVVLAPYASTGRYGARSIFYNRIHSSELPTFIVPWEGERYISEILPKINNRYGIYLTMDDVNDGAVPTPSVGQNNVTINVEFKPGSFVFYGTAKIQIGQNDPTGDTQIEEPFATNFAVTANTSALAEGSRLDPTASLFQDFTTLAVDRFATRQESSTPGDVLFGSGALQVARRNLLAADVTFAVQNGTIPFVGMWADAAKNSYGITPAGEVYKLAADGITWSFSGNPLNYPLSTSKDIAAAYKACNVKAMTQTETGRVFILALNSAGNPSFFALSSEGKTPVEQPISKVRSLVLDKSYWKRIFIADMFVADDRIGVIADAAATVMYPNDSPLGFTMPAVEIFTIGGTNNYYSLSDAAKTKSSIEFKRYDPVTTMTATPKHHMRFITPVPGSNRLDVVAVCKGLRSGSIYPVVFRFMGVTGYEAKIIPNANIGWDNFEATDFSIAGWRTPLTTSRVQRNGVDAVGAYLEVIECIAPVSTAAPDAYFNQTKHRRQNGFLSYGVSVFSTIGIDAGASNGWTYSGYPLSGQVKPRQIIAHGVGQRQVYNAQPGHAIIRTRMNQAVGSQSFRGEAGLFIPLTGARSMTNILFSGAAALQPWAPVVDVNTTVVIADETNPDASLTAVGMSFIAKDASNNKTWLVQPQGANAPEARIPSNARRFLGTCPALTMACGNNLLYVADNGNGIYVSPDNGLTWNEFNSFPSFYQQERAGSNAQFIVGTSQLRLDQEFFQEGIFDGTNMLLDVKMNASAQVLNFNNSNVSQTVTLTDNTLVVIGDYRIQKNYRTNSSGPGSSFGINPLSSFSPRTMFAWDSDANANFETIGTYSVDAAAPNAVKWNQDNYLFAMNATLLDFSRDVRYLGFKHWIYVIEKEEVSPGVQKDVWKLHFTNAVQPEKTIELFGSSLPEGYSTFKPKVSFHLWDYEDTGAGYIPYVFVEDLKVLILERIDEDGSFQTNLRTLTIPADNGSGLKPVKMYTANRRDYYFYQKGNGIFKLGYDYQGGGSGSNVALLRVSNLTAASLRDLDIISGSVSGIAAKNAPLEGVIPSNLPEGTFMGWICQQGTTTKVARYADGNGGYTEVITQYSTDCGYVPPPTDFAGMGTGSGGADSNDQL